MRRNLALHPASQVFLNYPFDKHFSGLANAMNFAVVAGGLLPVCASDLGAPDKPRLEMLVEAIRSCDYSAHDLSRSRGGGSKNHARMNMPLELGMALFRAHDSQRRAHRFTFSVSSSHDYMAFASDLAGLDPQVHGGDEIRLLTNMYEWLRGVVPSGLFNAQPSVEVIDKFAEFKARLVRVRGSGGAGQPSHEETREVMYGLCSELGWWDWRGNRMGKDEFPIVSIVFAGE
ncbi:MAG: hypothetical protein ACLQVJ_17755 [Syntrophobacteraceae bacterium]